MSYFVFVDTAIVPIQKGVSTMENWYVFGAYNSQSHFGFGTAEEAAAYCDVLNRGKDFNLFGYSQLAEGECASLNSGENTDGFRLDLALDADAENQEWLEQQNAL